jgi:hypothetical protein
VPHAGRRALIIPVLGHLLSPASLRCKSSTGIVGLAIVGNSDVKTDGIPLGGTANTAFADSSSRAIGNTITGLGSAFVMPDDMHRSTNDRLLITMQCSINVDVLTLSRCLIVYPSCDDARCRWGRGRL